MRKSLFVLGIVGIVWLLSSGVALGQYIHVDLYGVFPGFADLEKAWAADLDLDGHMEMALKNPVDPTQVRIYDIVTGELENQQALGASITQIALTPAIVDGIWAVVVMTNDNHCHVFVHDQLNSAASDGEPSLFTRQMSSAPNPFNPRTTISFALELEGKTSLSVYDASGREVRTLVDGYLEAGSNSVIWDGRNDAGEQLASGTYFYRLSQSGRELGTRKAVILK